MAKKKRRKTKLTAKSREWVAALLLEILSTVIGAALVKLLGLTKATREPGVTARLPCFYYNRKIHKNKEKIVMSVKGWFWFIVIFCIVRTVLYMIFKH